MVKKHRYDWFKVGKFFRQRKLLALLLGIFFSISVVLFWQRLLIPTLRSLTYLRCLRWATPTHPTTAILVAGLLIAGLLVAGRVLEDANLCCQIWKRSFSSTCEGSTMKANTIQLRFFDDNSSSKDAIYHVSCLNRSVLQ